jgi:hypothetical protein
MEWGKAKLGRGKRVLGGLRRRNFCGGGKSVFLIAPVGFLRLLGAERGPLPALSPPRDAVAPPRDDRAPPPDDRAKRWYEGEGWGMGGRG